MNTETVRTDIDKERKHQCRWLAQKLVEALDEIDRLKARPRTAGDHWPSLLARDPNAKIMEQV